MNGPADPLLNAEYHNLRAIRDLGHELAGDRPYAPGNNQQIALAKITRLLAGNPFPTLLSTPPPTADNDTDNDVIAVVLTTFTVFTVVWDAATRVRSLQPPMRTMWPHIVKWGALLHPARGRLQTRRGNWSTGREVTGLAQAYMSIAEADPAYVRPFILENEDFAAQALELWLRFPRYVPRSAMDESGTSHAAIVVAHAVYNLLGNELKPYADEESLSLFRSILKRVAKRRRTLYLAAAEQTEFLTQISIMPLLVARIWEGHYALLGGLFGLEAGILGRDPLWRTSSSQQRTSSSKQRTKSTRIPSRIATALVAAGIKCAKAHDMPDAQVRDSQDAARCAAQVLALLLNRIADDNRLLARAVGAGAFDLLRSLENAAGPLPTTSSGSQTAWGGSPDEKPATLYDHSELARHICAGLSQARVVRAFYRRHPQPWDVGPVLSPKRGTKGRGMQTPTATWQDVARAWNAAREVYLRSHKKREWREVLECGNRGEPTAHDRFARACPCGNAFYCSRSCQHAEWEARHREECLAEEGVWGLGGALSLSDALFVCAVVRNYVAANWTAIGMHMSALKLGGKKDKSKQSTKQPTILVNLTDVAATHEVYAASSSVEPMKSGIVGVDAPRRVLVEVSIQLGQRQERRVLPFSYDVAYFKGSLGL
ncbi:hypothetical protein K523DRAFT_419370 [Schizophyllum commune Tattone D]|nr:hypothetical protein K523DRAFT_419370 [Schizophyllum commune Tattone D]